MLFELITVLFVASLISPVLVTLERRLGAGCGIAALSINIAFIPVAVIGANTADTYEYWSIYTMLWLDISILIINSIVLALNKIREMARRHPLKLEFD